MCQLKEPFKEYNARSVASFLRCIYAPDDATPANFALLPGDALVGLARLAHYLDTPGLLKKLDAHLRKAGEWRGEAACPAPASCRAAFADTASALFDCPCPAWPTAPPLVAPWFLSPSSCVHAVDGADTEDVLRWMELAQQCRLDRLRGIRKLALALWHRNQQGGRGLQRLYVHHHREHLQVRRGCAGACR